MTHHPYAQSVVDELAEHMHATENNTLEWEDCSEYTHQAYRKTANAHLNTLWTILQKEKSLSGDTGIVEQLSRLNQNIERLIEEHITANLMTAYEMRLPMYEIENQRFRQRLIERMKLLNFHE